MTSVPRLSWFAFDSVGTRKRCVLSLFSKEIIVVLIPLAGGLAFVCLFLQSIFLAFCPNFLNFNHIQTELLWLWAACAKAPGLEAVGPWSRLGKVREEENVWRNSKSIFENSASYPMETKYSYCHVETSCVFKAINKAPAWFYVLETAVLCLLLFFR